MKKHIAIIVMLVMLLLMSSAMADDITSEIDYSALETYEKSWNARMEEWKNSAWDCHSTLQKRMATFLSAEAFYRLNHAKSISWIPCPIQAFPLIC